MTSKLFPILLVVTFLLLSFRVVSAGEIAVVTRFGRVTGRVLEPGANFIIPVFEATSHYNTKKIIYETAEREKQQASDADYKDYPVDTNTEDGQQVDIFYTVRFSIDPTKAAWVAQNIGSEIALVEKVVKTESRIWARNIPRRFTADTLYTGDGSVQVQNEIFDALKSTFEENGLILDSVGIREIKFTQEYIGAIETKQIEAVKVETEKNKAEQAIYQKEARITQAEGQAQEQRLQRETLNEQVLQKIKLDNQKVFIDKWNGVMPKIVGSEGTLFDVTTLLE
ncbi:prohibitin family protein [Patescibacteria group bacterium]|nr:prohibitin family protein [Patescibacteria group bacterium]